MNHPTYSALLRNKSSKRALDRSRGGKGVGFFAGGVGGASRITYLSSGLNIEVLVTKLFQHAKNQLAGHASASAVPESCRA